MTPNKKKLAIIENLSERQNFIKIAKETILEFNETNDGFPIVSQKHSNNLDNTFDDNTFLPKPINQNKHLNF